MAFDITKELKQTYGKAALANEARKNLNGAEWKEFQQIKAKFEEQKLYEQRTFELEYKTRVEVARKRLINKAGEKNRDFKHRWFGSDRFDKDATLRQAKRQVRNEHAALLSHLDKQEMAEVEGLLERSVHRQKLRDKPKVDFARATDRRDGAERRAPRSRQRE